MARAFKGITNLDIRDDVAGDGYVDVERELAAAMSRD